MALGDTAPGHLLLMCLPPLQLLPLQPLLQRQTALPLPHWPCSKTLLALMGSQDWPEDCLTPSPMLRVLVLGVRRTCGALGSHGKQECMSVGMLQGRMLQGRKSASDPPLGTTYLSGRANQSVLSLLAAFRSLLRCQSLKSQVCGKSTRASRPSCLTEACAS